MAAAVSRTSKTWVGRHRGCCTPSGECLSIIRTSLCSIDAQSTTGFEVSVKVEQFDSNTSRR
ncbi:hypothetical protein ZEAMMB73_Zm00001d003143 [Zea mays]|uniref:Uncharacterized protein n=1 Tax=Zea mays TaxID=4577 RepID=A0A1D6E6Z7_MAIZE|nr:hypothetical protein ZEAMMB73_Zm00001d003143 [Zea mays]